MPALPFPSATAPVTTYSPYSEYTQHTEADGTPIPAPDIPIDPALLDGADVIPHRVDARNGDEHGHNLYVVSKECDDDPLYSLWRHDAQRSQYTQPDPHSLPCLPTAEYYSPSFHTPAQFSLFGYPDIPPPPSLQEQLEHTQLPPTPPHSYIQPKPPKTGPAKRRHRKKPVQKPVAETDCSFCQGDDQSNKHGVPEPMASCTACGRSGHPSCMEIPHLTEVIRSYPWRCQECKECEVCKAKGDDSRMLFCDQCDRGWHFDCLTPPLGRAPRGKWSCPLCTSSTPSTSKLPPSASKPPLATKPKPRRKSTAVTATDSIKSHSPVINADDPPINGTGKGKGKGKAAKPRGVPFPVLTPETDGNSLDVDHRPDTPAANPEALPSPRPSSAATPVPAADQPPAPLSPQPLAPSSPQHPTFSSPIAPTSSPRAHRTSATTLRFKRTPTQALPTRPLKVRIRVTSKSDAEGAGADVIGTKEDAGEASESELFGGILKGQDADTSKTVITREDKDRFEASRVGSEVRINKLAATAQPFNYFSPITPAIARISTASSSTYQLPGYVPTRSHRSIAQRTGSPPPTTPTISTPGGIVPQALSNNANSNNGNGTEGLRIKTIRFGQFDIDTWYDAPFPEEFSQIPEGRLWMCEFCLKYMRSRFGAGRHKMKCKMRCPPGDEIYRDGSVSVFEVDGRRNKIYCQNLCLLSKMFLDHKSLFYDVEPFLFYVMTEVDDDGARFVGYFSKEKMSPKDYNVSCIMTLPVRQRQGWGNLLIDFSYLLSLKEGRTGTPERPLSALGALSYKNYWKLAIMLYLRRINGRVRIRDISAATSITPEDVYETLRDNRFITGPGTSIDGHSVATPKTQGRKRGPGRPPGRPTEKQKQGHGHESTAPVELPRKYSVRWDPEQVKGYVENWERKGHLRLKPDRLKWVPYRLSRVPVAPQALPPTDGERSESDDPESDGSEESAAPTVSVRASVPRSKTRSRALTSHASDDEEADADEDEDEEQAAAHVMTRRSRSRQSTQNSHGGRYDTPERRSLRSTVLGSTVLSRKSSMQSQLGVGRRAPSPEDTPIPLRHLRSRSMQHLRGEQITPVRRTPSTRGRAGREDKEKPSPPSPPVRKVARRESPIRKRRRIESSPEPTPPSSPGKKRTANGKSNGRARVHEPSDGEADEGPSPANRRDARSVSLGSGLVYDDMPPVQQAVPPFPLPDITITEDPTSSEPARAFTSDSGSPLTSVKEELTDDASEGATMTADIDDEDALGDEDAEGEPDEDAEGEVDESIF